MADLAPTSPVPHSLDRMASMLFAMSIKEGWSGHLLYHLFDGGGVTMDRDTRRPILITKKELDEAMGNAADRG